PPHPGSILFPYTTLFRSLPPDLANGIILNILKNIRPDTAETKVSYVAATPKPRLVKLSIVPRGEDRFSVVGTRYKATLFVLKVRSEEHTSELQSPDHLVC